MRWDCARRSSPRRCGGLTDTADPLCLAACPRCNGVDMEAADGAELVLESIAFAVPDGGRT